MSGKPQAYEALTSGDEILKLPRILSSNTQFTVRLSVRDKLQAVKCMLLVLATRHVCYQKYTLIANILHVAVGLVLIL